MRKQALFSLVAMKTTVQLQYFLNFQDFYSNPAGIEDTLENVNAPEVI